MMPENFMLSLTVQELLCWQADKQTNKPVGDDTPRLAQMSLPWQQGSAHNILHGSIESAIPENPLVSPNIFCLSAIQADL